MFNLNEFNEIKGNNRRRKYFSSFNECVSLRKQFTINSLKSVTSKRATDINVDMDLERKQHTKPQCHHTLVHNAIILLNNVKFYSFIFLLFICLPKSIKALQFQPALLNNTFAALEGDGVVIKCLDTFTNTSLVWIKGYRELPSSEGNVKTSSFGNGQQISLFITSISPQNAGEYKCQSMDKKTRQVVDILTLKIIVYKKIEFRSKNELTVRENGTANLECVIAVDYEIKSATFTWKMNDNPIENNNRYSISSKEYFSQLIIKKVNRNDTGVYVCELHVVYDLAFKIEEHPITLNVSYKPEFAPNIPKYIWIPGKGKMSNQTTVNITCIVDANPRAVFEWKRGISRITQTSDYVNQIDDINMSTLVIKRPERRSDYEEIIYSCSASNQAGISKHDFIVKEGTYPEKPRLMNFSYTGSKLVLVIEENYAAPKLDFYRLDFGDFDVKFDAIQRSKDEMSKIRNETYSISLPNNVRGQQSFKLFAHNPIGWSQPSQDNSYTVYISDAIKLVNNGLLLFLMIVLFKIIH